MQVFAAEGLLYDNEVAKVSEFMLWRYHRYVDENGDYKVTRTPDNTWPEGRFWTQEEWDQEFRSYDERSDDEDEDDRDDEEPTSYD